MKMKRNIPAESISNKAESGETEAVVETCRTCGLREEANRKVAHERFLVCGNCSAKCEYCSIMDYGCSRVLALEKQ